MQDNMLMPGISDPGLPEPDARQQALHRACAMAALSQNMNGRYYSDYFTKNVKEDADSRFSELYRFSTFFSNMDNKVRVVHETLLNSKEAVLLVAVPAKAEPSAGDRILKFEGYLYNHELEVDQHDQYLRKIEAFISGKGSDNSFFHPDSVLFYQINQRFTGIKNLQRQKFPDFTGFEYYYTCHDTGTRDPDNPDESLGSSCKSGLWIAFLNQVFDQLSYFIRQNIDQAQQVSDQTPDTRISMNREKDMEMLKFSFTDIGLSDNKLLVKIMISHEK